MAYRKKQKRTQQNILLVLSLVAVVCVLFLVTVTGGFDLKKNKLLASFFRRDSSQLASAYSSRLGPCNLLSAVWDTASVVSRDKLVLLSVKSSGNCIGQQVKFSIFKYEGGSTPTASSDSIDPVNLLVNGASTSWSAEYNSSGYLDASSNANYYFEASLVSDPTKKVSSSDPMLAVSSTPSSTIYFIDSAGSNTNNGLTKNAPWADFTNLSNITLQPGDQVLLKRGGIWNQQLTISGKGSATNFITVGAYGSGARPKICRNGDISERAVRINNASNMTINSLEVCNAGAGIIVFYNQNPGNNSVYFNDILGHDFQGIYGGTGAHSSNPSWQSYVSADRVGYSYAIGITGTDALDQPGIQASTVITDFKVMNSELYKAVGIAYDWNSYSSNNGDWLGYAKYTDSLIDNVYMHDNDFADVSAFSLFIAGCTNCSIKNTLIVNGAKQGPDGTTTIYLGATERTSIDNLAVFNTPLSSTSDNSAIDFEVGNNNAIVQNSWFENNAGGAIEFLANSNVPNLNAEIKTSTFINNGWAQKFPNQGQIMNINWPQRNNSTGTIHDNFYQNPTDVLFFGGDGANNGGFTLTNNNDIFSPPTPTSAPTPTPFIDTQAPSVPTGLVVTVVSRSQITLTWNASVDNVGVTGYRIYRNNVYRTTVTGTSYIDNNVSRNKTYSYYIIAKDAANNFSSPSNTTTVKTLRL